MGKAKVLVVDDDENIIALLNESLTAAGMEVVTATRGREALEIAWKALPDFAIVDIVLPDITGWQVVSQLKKDFRTSAIEIVILSSQPPELTGPLLEKMGLKHFISKPADPRKITELLASLAKQKS